MKKPICCHCIHPCKQLGKSECNNYEPIANSRERLKNEIKKECVKGNYDIARKFQTELDKLN